MSWLRRKLRPIRRKITDEQLWCWWQKRGNEALVRLLIEDAADLEERGRYGGTALACAVARGHEATVKLLVDKGAEIEKVDDNSCTALLRAAAGGHEATVELLIGDCATAD